MQRRFSDLFFPACSPLDLYTRSVHFQIISYRVFITVSANVFVIS